MKNKKGQRTLNLLVAVLLLLGTVLTGITPAKAQTEVMPAGDQSITATTVNLTSTGDTYLRQGYPKRNYGGTTTVSVSNGSNKQNSLYKWNLSTIPPGSTVTAASITFYVTDSASVDFSLFSMKRAWVEGTSNDTESTSSANYNTYDGDNSWGTAGAMNTDSDRYNTDLWDATGGSSGTFSTKGLVTIPLNASGITTVQGWVNDPSVNFGVTMQFTGTGVSSPDYWIVASKENTTSGYTAPTLNVTYEAAGPTITTSVSELEPFSTPPSMASAAQTYTLSGVNLTADIVITAPGGFEVSLDNVAWDVTKTLTPSAGTIPSTTIYVRMAGTSEGSFSGDITHTSTGATQKDVTVSGVVTPHYSLSVTAGTGGSVTLDPLGGFYPSGTEVTLTAVPDSGYTFNHWSGDLESSLNPATLTMDGNKSVTANFAVSLCTTVNLVTIGDTRIRSSAATTNYGSETTVRMSPFTTSPQGGLFKWDLSSVPSDVIVDSASISFYVTDASANQFSLYDLRRDWGESSATWRSTGTTNWTTAGAASTTGDRYNTNLWSGSFNTAGDVTLDLNADGVDVIQGWIDKTKSNYGLTVQNYSGGSGQDYWDVASKENTSNYTKPTLNITYCVPSTDPTIVTSKTSLEPFITQPGVPSAAQSYTVTGANLTEDISVVAPSGFEIASTIDGTYAANLTLPMTGGTVFVRLNSINQGTFSGSIAHNSTDAVAKYVSVEGTVSKQVCYTNQEFVTSADTYISGYGSSTTNNNYGAQTYIRVTLGTPGTTQQPRGSLVRWDLSDLPDGAVVSNASLKLYVETAGSATFNLYNMKRAWVEGSGTGSATGDGATWATYDGTNAWGTNGAASTTLDRDNTNLWGANSSSFNSQGIKTVALNSDGLAVVQGWVDGSPNYGLTIQNYTSGSTDVQFSSKNNATEANRPRLILDYCVGANIAPSQPELVRPADESTGIAIPPTLEVKVTDLDEDPMDVSFYGRPVSVTTPAEDFLFIAIPDTQTNAQSHNTVLQDQFTWIANRYTNPGPGNPDLVFVTHLGDLVNTASSTTQWGNIDTAFDKLDAAGVPYSVGPGNHDDGTLYSTNFGSSRFTGKPWYQGSYAAGNDNYNSYSFFSAGGMDFIVINLQYSPTTAILNWADALLKTHSDRRAIVVQHDLLNVTTNAWSNSATYTALSDNPNLFLMLCGHNHSGEDGSAYRIETRTGMAPVHALLTDYQDLSGKDFIRLLTFKPADDEIYAQVFSPYNPGGYKTDANNYEQFTMAYDMDGEAGLPFELIGTINGVTSGSNASISWPGRLEGTEYEWYAVANDGSKSTSSDIWTFTTLETSLVEITGFSPIIPLQAGSEGSALDLAGVQALLPTTATATFTGGTVQVPVVSWSDTDSYDSTTAGSYTFTAELGAIPAGYVNPNNYTATIEVVVSAPEIRSLTMAVNPTGAGTTIPVVGSHSYIVGTVVNISATAATGYEFDKWSGDVANANVSSTTVTMDTAKTVTANFIPKTFVVSFVANGGTPTPAPINVTFGEAYGTLPVVTRTGYTFAGWFTADSGGTEVKADTTVSNASAHTLYARWTANTYNVTFDSNGGTPSPTAKNVTFGLAYGTLPTVTRAGYTFNGWFTADTGGTEVTASTIVATAFDHTLYAHWTANNYTVTFVPNGGTPTPDSLTVTFGSAYGTLPVVSRTGYTFNGWFTADSGGTVVTAATTVATASDHSLYARWTAIPYTLTIGIEPASSGTVGKSPNQTTYVYNDVVTLTPQPAAGFEFDKWEGADADDVVTSGGVYTIVMTANKNIIAKFKALPSFTVTFNGNGATAGSMAAQTANVITKLTKNTFTRTGFVFTGWNTDAGGNGTSYADEANYDFKEDLELYAQWSAQPSVSYELATTIEVDETYLVVARLSGGDFAMNSTVYSGGQDLRSTAVTIEGDFVISAVDSTMLWDFVTGQGTGTFRVYNEPAGYIRRGSGSDGLILKAAPEGTYTDWNPNTTTHNLYNISTSSPEPNWYLTTETSGGTTYFTHEYNVAADNIYFYKQKLVVPEPGIAITAVTITGIDAPVAEATPDIEAAVAAAPTAGITGTTATVSWSPDDSPFKYATVYTASVTLTAAEGHEFTEDTAVTVNGNAATVTLNANGTLTVTYTFPKTGDAPLTEIEAVAITGIDVPAAGGNPDTTANVAATPAAGITGTTATVSWSPDDSPFKYATVYTASVTLSAAAGFEFTDGTTATVNGQTATVTLNANGTLTVTYKFPITGDAPITAVAISDIVAPVALATPDDEAVVAATPTAGITGTTADVTWDPDVSNFNYATVYTASVTLTAAEGFEFTDDTTATVNGQTATTVTLNEDGTLTVTYTFPKTGDAPLKTITAVTISDIVAPVAQATPDTEAAVVATPGEGIDSSTAVVIWTPNDSPFKYGTVYTASVTLTAAEGYEFTAATVATVNGLTATTVTLNEDGTLTVTYTFPATEAESHGFTIFLPLILR